MQHTQQLDHCYTVGRAGRHRELQTGTTACEQMSYQLIDLHPAKHRVDVSWSIHCRNFSCMLLVHVRCFPANLLCHVWSLNDCQGCDFVYIDLYFNWVACGVITLVCIVRIVQWNWFERKTQRHILHRKLAFGKNAYRRRAACLAGACCVWFTGSW